MNIEQLLEKYWEAETTPEEERQLKAFFVNTPELPPHLDALRPQFVFFAEAKQEELGDEFDRKLLQKLPPAAKTLPLQTSQQKNVWQWVSGVAAGLLLFAAGYFAGNRPMQNPSEIGALKQEMKSLKESVMLSQLKQSSASERLKGVNYVSEMHQESPEVINALIETLNSDENTNVRMAAANALFVFRDVQKVRDALVESIKKQEDPAVKIALINMMIALKEKKAKPAIEEFLQKEPIPQQVKETIKKELQNI